MTYEMTKNKKGHWKLMFKIPHCKDTLETLALIENLKNEQQT